MSEVQILHAIPGRIRFKISQVKENPAFAKQLELTLARMQMVQWSKINSRIGSVLIGYDSGLLVCPENQHQLKSLASIPPMISLPNTIFRLCSLLVRKTPIRPRVVSILLASISTGFRSGLAMQMELVAMRHQVAVYKQSISRPKLQPSDR
jgi:Heavy metal associated domain 2